MEKGFQLYEQELSQHRLTELTEKLERAEVSADVLQEAYSDAVRQMFAAEDIGWQRIGGPEGNNAGNNLRDCQMIASKLSDWSDSNPLLKRGREIRNSYQFAQPYEIGTTDAKGKITPQQWNVINSPENQAAVFSLTALEEIESQRFEAGNTFTQWDRNAKKFQQIPFGEVADVLYDPLNKNQLRYVKRVVEYNTMMEDGVERPRKYEAWIPVSNYTPDGGFPTRIGEVLVDATKRMIVTRVNRKVGSVFGIPDAFAAAPWALAYSAYLRDGTKVLAALAEWVWQVSPKKRPAAERAAAVHRSERGAGGTLFTDMDVKSLPRNDAVDLNTGRPLASNAAAALGISVVVLLADPGQSGAYGTAQTLSDPNRRTMQARREVNSEFLRECLRLVGVKNPDVVWAKMAPGTDLEEGQLLASAWGTGLFQADEIRPRLAAVAQINLIDEHAPEGVLIPNNAASWQRGDIDPKDAPSTVDMDGTTSQTNGVGRDNAGLGALSRMGSSQPTE